MTNAKRVDVAAKTALSGLTERGKEVIEAARAAAAGYTVQAVAPTDPHTLSEIERMASQGMRWPQISLALRTPPTTFEEWIKARPDVRRAIAYGLGRGIDMISAALQRRALDGEVAAIALYLKQVARGAFGPAEAEGGPAGASSGPVLDGNVQAIAARHRALLDDDGLEAMLR